MLKSYRYKNVRQAYYQMFRIFERAHPDDFIKKDSRNGPVTKFNGPVAVGYEKPRERVLYDPDRNANPFFHYFEAMWMLAGRNDLASLEQFVSTFGNYSDDGETLHGAYGHRWKKSFGYDQLEVIIEELRKNPDTRRCVLAMWNAANAWTYDTLDDGPSERTPLFVCDDLYVATHGGKDVPCNTHIYFDVNDGVLSMTVCNRSNDGIWGMLGANYVHMSFLQEYVALATGNEVGHYYQFTNNCHVYDNVFKKLSGPSMDHFDNERFPEAQPLFFSREVFDNELEAFFSGISSPEPVEPTIRDMSVLVETYKLAKEHKYEECLAGLQKLYAPDWRLACQEWVERKAERYETKRQQKD